MGAAGQYPPYYSMQNDFYNNQLGLPGLTHLQTELEKKKRESPSSYQPIQPNASTFSECGTSSRHELLKLSHNADYIMATKCQRRPGLQCLWIVLQTPWGQSPTNHEKRGHPNSQPQNLDQTQESSKRSALGFKLSFLGSLRSAMGWGLRNAWWISSRFPRGRCSSNGSSSFSSCSNGGIKLCKSSRTSTTANGSWVRGSISISTSSRRLI